MLLYYYFYIVLYKIISRVNYNYYNPFPWKKFKIPLLIPLFNAFIEFPIEYIIHYCKTMVDASTNNLHILFKTNTNNTIMLNFDIYDKSVLLLYIVVVYCEIAKFDFVLLKRLCIFSQTINKRSSFCTWFYSCP